MSECILDASALLAYLYDENGADRVEQALSRSTCIGSNSDSRSTMESFIIGSFHSNHPLTNESFGQVRICDQFHLVFQEESV
jgi:uncharacterized protein with PIN domain